MKSRVLNAILNLKNQNPPSLPPKRETNGAVFLNLMPKFIFGMTLISIVLTLSLITFAQRKTVRPKPKTAVKTAISPGEKVFDEASTLFEQNTKESLEAALGKFQEARQLYLQSGDKSGEAASVTMIGRTYKMLGNGVEGYKQYQEAVKLYHDSNDRKGEASALNNIGAVARDYAYYNEAINYYKAALPLMRETNNKYGEATTLTGLGLTYSLLRQSNDALNYLNQALTLWKTLNSKKDETNTLLQIADVYSSSEETFSQALPLYNQALITTRASNQPLDEGEILEKIGIYYDKSGAKDKALENFKNAQALYQRASTDRQAPFRIIFSKAYIGDLYFRMGQQENALANLEASLSLAKEKNLYVMSTIFAALGDVYNLSGNQTKAAELFNQGLSFAQQNGDKRAYAANSIGLGEAYLYTNQPAESLKYFNQAMPLSNDYTVQSRIFAGIIRANTLLGNSDAARQAVQQAQNLKVNDGDFEAVFEVVNATAFAMNRFDTPQNALQMYNRALAIANKTGYRIGTARALFGSGFVYEKMGNSSNALDAFNQALPIWQGMGNSFVEANIFIEIGNQNLNQSRWQPALDAFNQALTLAQNNNSPPTKALALNNIGVAYMNLGDNNKAIDYYNQALPLYESLNDRPSQARTFNNLALVYEKLGDKKRAKDYRKKAEQFKN